MFTPLTDRQKNCSRACSNAGRGLRGLVTKRYAYCDRAFTTSNGRIQCCSKACATRAGSPPKATVLTWARCRRCERWYVKRKGNLCCSVACRDADNLIRIADRVMGFYRTAITNLEIPQAMHWHRELVAYLATRDGSACAICTKPVDLTLVSGPRGDRRGPSIDHVIPRSHGGTDDLPNLRLTHWCCNQTRGNRGGNEQLRLVG